MAPPDWKLSIITLAERWDGKNDELQLRVLVLPRGNPLQPLIERPSPAASELPFANASLALQAMLIPSLDRLPDPSDVTATRTLNVLTPPNLVKLYRELAKALPLAPAGSITRKAEPRRHDTQIKKFLPVSYREAFPFEQPRPFTFVDDTYRCALRTPPKAPPLDEPNPGMSWGEVLAAVLQQPRLAERLGLVYAARVTLPSATFLENGGWVFAALAAGSDYVGLAPPAGDQTKYYAARLPELKSGSVRPLFTAVMFPVLSGPPPASYVDNFLEAELYDDGFAKIVHCAQPLKTEFPDAGSVSEGPVQDAGIQLGWDDEQLATWMNRQVDPAFAIQDSPMAVHGYRVDVRKAGTVRWSSLSRVAGELRLGTAFSETFEGEHSFRVAPVQLHGLRTGDYWLPAYLANWTGGSLVTRDEYVSRITSGAASASAGFTAVGLDAVPLRYSESYEFRVRLADIAGGSPGVADDPVNPAPSPVAKCSFRRFVPPKSVTMVKPAAIPDPANPQTHYKILRPLLGHPSLVFTGFPNALPALIADIPNARTEGREVGLPDPDVSTLEIGIEVRDPGLGLQSAFRTIRVCTREFPRRSGDPTKLDLLFQDFNDIEKMPPATTSGPVIVPTARDVRLRLTAVCRPDPDLTYFGSETARRSEAIYIYTRANATDERNLFVPQSPGKQLQAILLQPDPVPGKNLAAVQAAGGRQQEAAGNLAGRLADQLRLDVAGLTFFGKHGRRTVMGSSAGLRHTLAPDHSAISVASKNDLIQHWIVVMTLQLDRDWTWDNLADVSFEIRREVKQLSTGAIETASVGTIEVRRTVSPTALQNPDVTKTDLFFFDAIDPKPPAGEFPSELEVTYAVNPSFKTAPTKQDGPLTLTMRLPIAVPPSQTPRLVSAGRALSPYHRAGDYSSTEPRQQMLWLEFEQPLDNVRDAYFARALAHAQDPMLSSESPLAPPAPADPPLPIDPELVRVIIPGQSDDRAGLDAMQELIPSASLRHFLIPLPPGLSPESPELFGFFVYEIRVGHAEIRGEQTTGWSTAQGRFGPALRVTGVQHPPPNLICQVSRRLAGITAVVPYATPVLDRRSRNLPSPTPKTDIWVLLYAQVTQVDGADRRNVLLGRKRAWLIPPRREVRETLDSAAVAVWDQSEAELLLRALALSTASALSVLAVELLPDSDEKPDPIGTDLGDVRILRTSPLMSVPAICA
jgi:hypothetical protein